MLRFPLDSLQTHISSHLLCSTVIVFKISFLYFVSSESTLLYCFHLSLLLLSASLVLPLSPSHSCVFRKAAGVHPGLQPTGHLQSLVSSRSCSGSACGCMIVNNYQPDTFPTPDLPSLATSRFLWNPHVTLSSCIISPRHWEQLTPHPGPHHPVGKPLRLLPSILQLRTNSL